jgi:hypothetical protein
MTSRATNNHKPGSRDEIAALAAALDEGAPEDVRVEEPVLMPGVNLALNADIERELTQQYYRLKKYAALNDAVGDKELAAGQREQMKKLLVQIGMLRQGRV